MEPWAECQDLSKCQAQLVPQHLHSQRQQVDHLLNLLVLVLVLVLLVLAHNPIPSQPLVDWEVA